MSPFTHTWPVSTSCRYGKRGREDTEIISVESSVTSISYAFSREINYSSPRKYELSLRNPAPIHPRSFFFSLPSDSPGLRRRILFCQFFFPVLYRRELSPDCASLILGRSILFATKFDARQESSSYTSVTGEKNEKGARCGPQSFSYGNGFTRTLNIHFMQHLSRRDRGSPGWEKSRVPWTTSWYPLVKTKMQIERQGKCTTKWPLRHTATARSHLFFSPFSFCGGKIKFSSRVLSGTIFLVIHRKYLKLCRLCARMSLGIYNERKER